MNSTAEKWRIAHDKITEALNGMSDDDDPLVIEALKTLQEFTRDAAHGGGVEPGVSPGVDGGADCE